MRHMIRRSAIISKVLVALVSTAAGQLSWAEDALRQVDPSFAGKISFSVKDSVPAWPTPVAAPKGAPNVLVILLDDVGYAVTELFGGPVQTPHLATLAARGLRYNNFNTTGICSPTRA